jgi:hypothetical protein
MRQHRGKLLVATAVIAAIWVMVRSKRDESTPYEQAPLPSSAMLRGKIVLALKAAGFAGKLNSPESPE